MTRLALFALALYRIVISPKLSRSCLFERSCSRHVEDVLRERGCAPAWRAFLARYRQCRPGFSCQAAAGVLVLRLRDGTSIPLHEASFGARAAAEAALRLEARLNARESAPVT